MNEQPKTPHGVAKGRGKGTRIRKRSTEVQIQELLNLNSLLDKEPANELTIAKLKNIQARISCLMAQQERQDKAKRDKALEAENERLKQQLAKTQVLEVLPVAPSVDPSDLAVARMLARIKSAVTPEPEPEPEAIVEPLPPTAEELALQAEREAEIQRKRAELTLLRKQQADREHAALMADLDAQCKAVEDQKEKMSGSYTPLTTDAMTGYLPQHLSRFKG